MSLPTMSPHSLSPHSLFAHSLHSLPFSPNSQSLLFCLSLFSLFSYLSLPLSMSSLPLSPLCLSSTFSASPNYRTLHSLTFLSLTLSSLSLYLSSLSLLLSSLCLLYLPISLSPNLSVSQSFSLTIPFRTPSPARLSSTLGALLLISA